MKIELHQISIQEIIDQYRDSDENGVVGYHGKLNIRPPFQREFVYKDKQRNAVIDTVRRGFPLNTIYWSFNKADNTYELLDGQQRTLSICQYISGDFSVDFKYFHNLTPDEQQAFLDYKLMVYICEGSESEKLEWFKIINIAGERLYDQELRNAVYTGAWLTDAKRYFSKNQCPAWQLAGDYMKGSPIRQEYLETVISWMNNGNIEDYMARHQHDSHANELWLYFNKVITWVKTIFPTYRKEMKGINWGLLYNNYGEKAWDANLLEAETAKLMADDDVTHKAGIYSYLLTGEEKHLSIRLFTQRDKRIAYEKQKGFCRHCKKCFPIEEMEADHITPWHEGGKTLADNCQMLCRNCNRLKGGK